MKQLFTILMLAISLQAMSINLVIDLQSGTNQVEDIALIGKWVFVGNDLQLLDKEGKLLASEKISNIRKITFSDKDWTSVDNIEMNNTIILYPNPTHDILHIQGIDAQDLRIYNMQGQMVHHTNGTQIGVEHLATGTYLLQVGTQVVRFIKQ